MNKFKIISVNISKKKGEKKTPVEKAVLQADFGIIGDAHSGDWHRQVSLLAKEDIEEMIKKGADVLCGDFAENITTEGINLPNLPIGTRLLIGEVVLEVTQIGKECHDRCAIYRQVGDCVMPTKGIFAKVITGGEISSESNCYYDLG